MWIETVPDEKGFYWYKDGCEDMSVCMVFYDLHSKNVQFLDDEGYVSDLCANNSGFQYWSEKIKEPNG